MKEKTFFKVTQDIVVRAENGEEAKSLVKKELVSIRGSYVRPYHKFTQPLCVREMELDQEKGEWIPIGNGGD